MKITWDNIDNFVYDRQKDMFSKRHTYKKQYQWFIGICKICGDLQFISKYMKNCGYCSAKCRLSNPEENPMYGRTHSQESKIKMSNNIVKKFGNDNHFYGRTHSQESKDKRMSNMPDQSGTNNPSWKGGVTSLGYASYDTYSQRLSHFDVKCRRNEDNNNILEVKCHKCEKWFIPTRYMVKNKIWSVNTEKGNNNLYCSDYCKGSCPIYGFNISLIDSLFINDDDKIKARLCQTNHLKQIQCDEYGYNYCERCGDIIDVDLHHTLPIHANGIGSIDSSGHILLCAGCHTHLHSTCV